MSIERMKQIMSRLNETVTLTSKDVERLSSQPLAIRQKLMKSLGKYSQDNNDAQSSADEFNKISGVSDDLTLDDEKPMFDGDDTFKSECNGIENERNAVDFFNALQNACINATKDTSYRFKYVRVSKDRISVFMNAAAHNTFTSNGDEFTFTLTKGISGDKCKILTIKLDWMADRANVVKANQVINLLKTLPQFKTSTTGVVDTINYTVTLK